MIYGNSADSGEPHADDAPAASGPLSGQLAPAQHAALVTRNLDATVSLPTDVLTEHMRRWQNRPVGERIALWAELFHERGDATYRFGLLEGGYVKDGLLVQDFKPDCVLFFYRCTDLARSQTPEEAVLRALETRFAERSSLNLGLLGTGGVCCFGRWRGRIEVDGRGLEIDGLPGWAEEFSHRW